MESVIIFSEVSEKEMAYKPQNYASAILSDGKKAIWFGSSTSMSMQIQNTSDLRCYS
jgi:hypothetical protein